LAIKCFIIKNIVFHCFYIALQTRSWRDIYPLLVMIAIPDPFSVVSSPETAPVFPPERFPGVLTQQIVYYVVIRNGF